MCAQCLNKYDTDSSWNLINSTDLHPRSVLGEEAVSQIANCAPSISTARSAKKWRWCMCFSKVRLKQILLNRYWPNIRAQIASYLILQLFKETSHTVYFQWEGYLVVCALKGGMMGARWWPNSRYIFRLFNAGQGFLIKKCRETSLLIIISLPGWHFISIFSFKMF